MVARGIVLSTGWRSFDLTQIDPATMRLGEVARFRRTSKVRGIGADSTYDGLIRPPGGAQYHLYTRWRRRPAGTRYQEITMIRYQPLFMSRRPSDAQGNRFTKALVWFLVGLAVAA